MTEQDYSVETLRWRLSERWCTPQVSRMKKEIWIGLFEVSVREGSDALGGNHGAYTNIAAWAINSNEFVMKAKGICDHLSLNIEAMENIEPLRRRRDPVHPASELAELISRVQSDPDTAAYGVFHGWVNEADK